MDFERWIHKSAALGSNNSLYHHVLFRLFPLVSFLGLCYKSLEPNYFKQSKFLCKWFGTGRNPKE